MQRSFTVKTGEFEGPLELLLTLVEERKMLVNDISLASVADDFLAYIKNHESFPLGTAAHFILVAATLLLLKSRSLLPVLTLSDDEEGDIRDLEFRLRLYQEFRSIARALSGQKMHMYSGGGATITDPIFAPSGDLSPDSIKEAIERVLQNAPEFFFIPETAVQKVISLEEMILRLSERIEKALTISFKDFSGSHAKDRQELVVGFLAMLELIKRGILLAKQEASFGDITMNYSGSAQTPSIE